jgi:NHL repeat
MITRRVCTKTSVMTLLVLVFALTVSAGAQAAGPFKLILASHFGWEVNENGSSICLVNERCRPGTISGEVGGFQYPYGVAGAPNGNFYVTDSSNHRVEEFTSTGEFVLMFGEEVNASTHKNICTEEEIKLSGVKCQVGIEGTGAGAFAKPSSVTIDPVTNNLYIVDAGNNDPAAGDHDRVDEYSATGQFILTIGSQVNATNDANPNADEAERNLCVSGEVCKAGAPVSEGSTEIGAFSFSQGQAELSGDLFAVGSASTGHLLYVGDSHRIEIFDSDGKFDSEDKLSGAAIATAPEGQITAIAVDRETGDIFFVYNNEPLIHKLLPSGEEVEGFKIGSTAGGRVKIRAAAMDAAGHLAVVVQEELGQQETQSGLLYQSATGHLITKFTVEGEANMQGVGGVGFSENGTFYTTVPQNQEVIDYIPEPVAELQTKGANCSPEAEHEGFASFDCTLNGEIDPFDIGQTEAWFDWGHTCAVGSSTSKERIATVEELLPVSATIQGLLPNELFCFQITGVDQNVRSPETLTGETAVFSTPKVSPKVLGSPSSSFVSASSADLYGELNPENTPSEYFFEYAPASGDALERCVGRAANCSGVTDTAALESEQYGNVGAIAEASNLQPSTAYRYRLAAVNQAGQQNGAEGEFTTAQKPKVEAETVAASAVTSTSALASGVVMSEGQPAVYAFEVGVYNGSATQYATVFSGQTGSGAGDEAESFMLTGLQPGTTYAYRISIDGGYENVQGAATLFTTAALQTLLSLPASVQMLPVPLQSRFPKVTVVCKNGTTLERGKCVKATKKVKKKKKARKRKGSAKK